MNSHPHRGQTYPFVTTVTHGPADRPNARFRAEILGPVQEHGTFYRARRVGTEEVILLHAHAITWPAAPKPKLVIEEDTSHV